MTRAGSWTWPRPNRLTPEAAVASALQSNPCSQRVGMNGVGVNPVTNRIYVGTPVTNAVGVLHIPLKVETAAAPLGGSIAATRSRLFGPNGTDFVGPYRSGAPSSSPLSRVFTKGTASDPALACPSSRPRHSRQEVEIHVGLGGSSRAMGRRSSNDLSAASRPGVRLPPQMAHSAKARYCRRARRNEVGDVGERPSVRIVRCYTPRSDQQARDGGSAARSPGRRPSAGSVSRSRRP